MNPFLSPRPAPWLGKIVGTLLCALFLSTAPASAEEHRLYPTTVALGAILPVETAHGTISPVVRLDHESKGSFLEGTLAIQFKTSVLSVGLRHSLGEVFALEYQGIAEGITVGKGSDLFFNGVHLKPSNFYGHGVSTMVAAHLFPESPWRAKFEVQQMATDFATREETDPAFVLPADFGQTELRLRLTRKGTLGSPKADLSLTFVSGERSGWKDWTLGTATHSGYSRTELVWNLPVSWSDTEVSNLKFNAFTGQNLDLFSGIGVGSYGGQLVVAGYYRNEFRAREAKVINFSHQTFFAKDRILSVFYDFAELKELELSYLAGSPASRRISGWGIGFRYGIRSLGGFPLIIRYGQGLGVPAGSAESHRQEILLVAAAGF